MLAKTPNVRGAMKDSTFARPKMVAEQARAVDRLLEDTALTFDYNGERGRIAFKPDWSSVCVAQVVNEQHAGWNVKKDHVMGRARTFGYFRSKIAKPAEVPMWSQSVTQKLDHLKMCMERMAKTQMLVTENQARLGFDYEKLEANQTSIMAYLTRTDPDWKSKQ